MLFELQAEASIARVRVKTHLYKNILANYAKKPPKYTDHHTGEGTPFPRPTLCASLRAFSPSTDYRVIQKVCSLTILSLFNTLFYK